MKKLLFLALIFLVLTSIAQISLYHPFPDSSAVWNFQRNVTCNSVFEYTNTYSIKISGDTLINNQEYHKLIKPFFSHSSNSTNCAGGEVVGYLGALRQDVLNKKIFFLPPSNTAQLLLYDFNMAVGDTVKGYIQGIGAEKDTVISIDSILIGTGYRKRWNINQDYHISFIEGVGSTHMV